MPEERHLLELGFADAGFGRWLINVGNQAMIYANGNLIIHGSQLVAVDSVEHLQEICRVLKATKPANLSGAY